MKAWLLYYSPVVLKEILHEDFYQHHLLLVEGVYLLLKNTVSEKRIKQSARLLQHYYIKFGALYGKYKRTIIYPQCMYTVNREYFDVKIFSDSMACAKIKHTKYMRNINDNAVQGCLSENYLTRKIIA